MFLKFKYSHWRKNYPTNILEYLGTPAPRGLRIMNFLVQKVLGVNGKCKMMVHFTSNVSGTINVGKGVVRSLANSGGCYLQGINGISIGDGTIFAAGVKIISANHSEDDLSQHEKAGQVVIGTDCWIGANAVILPGVELGDRVIVGAGSVITKSFASNVTVAGVPAKIIQTRSGQDQIESGRHSAANS